MKISKYIVVAISESLNTNEARHTSVSTFGQEGSALLYLYLMDEAGVETKVYLLDQNGNIIPAVHRWTGNGGKWVDVFFPETPSPEFYYEIITLREYNKQLKAKKEANKK